MGERFKLKVRNSTLQTIHRLLFTSPSALCLSTSTFFTYKLPAAVAFPVRLALPEQTQNHRDKGKVGDLKQPYRDR
jgi:hypothetical protein